jgi:hypothetical protein
MRTTRNAMVAAAMFAASTLPAAAAEVYFIRGAFDVFSNGMNQMVSQLKARGVSARGLSNGQWSSVANDIIKRNAQGQVSFPIVIAGHSVGGQEAPQFNDKLWRAGVPVALVIGVDPGFAPPPPFTAGTTRVVDFYIPNTMRGNPYRSSASFQGTIENRSIRSLGSTVDHVGIDKDPIVQQAIIAEVMAAVNAAAKPVAPETVAAGTKAATN